MKAPLAPEVVAANRHRAIAAAPARAKAAQDAAGAANSIQALRGQVAELASLVELLATELSADQPPTVNLGAKT